MWEEHPEYQKQQARLIGLSIVGILAAYLGYAVIHEDWDLLKTTLLVAGSLLAALGILSGSACLLVKLLTRGRPHPSRRKQPPNG